MAAVVDDNNDILREISQEMQNRFRDYWLGASINNTRIPGTNIDLSRIEPIHLTTIYASFANSLIPDMEIGSIPVAQPIPPDVPVSINDVQVAINDVQVAINNVQVAVRANDNRGDDVIHATTTDPLLIQWQTLDKYLKLRLVLANLPPEIKQRFRNSYRLNLIHGRMALASGLTVATVPSVIAFTVKSVSDVINPFTFTIIYVAMGLVIMYKSNIPYLEYYRILYGNQALGFPNGGGIKVEEINVEEINVEEIIDKIKDEVKNLESAIKSKDLVINTEDLVNGEQYDVNKLLESGLSNMLYKNVNGEITVNNKILKEIDEILNASDDEFIKCLIQSDKASMSKIEKGKGGKKTRRRIKRKPKKSRKSKLKK